jgi:hypothetical protein
MKTLAKLALLGAVAGMVAVSTATPSDAHWSRYHHRHHVRVLHGHGAYAYAPRRHWTASNRNEHRCMLSPASKHYVPCMNRP